MQATLKPIEENKIINTDVTNIRLMNEQITTRTFNVIIIVLASDNLTLKFKIKY